MFVLIVSAFIENVLEKHTQFNGNSHGRPATWKTTHIVQSSCNNVNRWPSSRTACRNHQKLQRERTCLHAAARERPAPAVAVRNRGSTWSSDKDCGDRPMGRSHRLKEQYETVGESTWRCELRNGERHLSSTRNIGLNNTSEIYELIFQLFRKLSEVSQLCL